MIDGEQNYVLLSWCGVVFLCEMRLTYSEHERTGCSRLYGRKSNDHHRAVQISSILGLVFRGTLYFVTDCTRI